MDLGRSLANIDVQDGIGMLVTPAPIRFLILSSQLREFHIFSVILFRPHAIRPIFVAIPRVIVVMFFVVVRAFLPVPVVLRP